MIDEPVVQVGESSPEHVAFKLFLEVAKAEGKGTLHGADANGKPNRAWILQTYAECLRAIKNYGPASKGKLGK